MYTRFKAYLHNSGSRTHVQIQTSCEPLLHVIPVGGHLAETIVLLRYEVKLSVPHLTFKFFPLFNLEGGEKMGYTYSWLEGYLSYLIDIRAEKEGMYGRNVEFHHCL